MPHRCHREKTRGRCIVYGIDVIFDILRYINQTLKAPPGERRNVQGPRKCSSVQSLMVGVGFVWNYCSAKILYRCVSSTVARAGGRNSRGSSRGQQQGQGQQQQHGRMVTDCSDADPNPQQKWPSESESNRMKANWHICPDVCRWPFCGFMIWFGGTAMILWSICSNVEQPCWEWCKNSNVIEGRHKHRISIMSVRLCRPFLPIYSPTKTVVTLTDTIYRIIRGTRTTKTNWPIEVS